MLLNKCLNVDVYTAYIQAITKTNKVHKDLAKSIDNPKAVRAVGTANGRNPICIIVPCHRVIAADGTLGGYIAGLGVKKKLLDLESANALQCLFCFRSIE